MPPADGNCRPRRHRGTSGWPGTPAWGRTGLPRTPIEPHQLRDVAARWAAVARPYWPDHSTGVWTGRRSLIPALFRLK